MALAGLGSPDGGACLGAESVEVAVFVDVPDIDVVPGDDEDAVGTQPLLMLYTHVAAEVVEERVVATTQRAAKKQEGGGSEIKIKFILRVHVGFACSLVWGLWPGRC